GSRLASAIHAHSLISHVPVLILGLPPGSTLFPYTTLFRSRRLAFRKSESNLLHWMLLLGADRLNMVEGLVQDLGRGRVPNIPAETGMRADWQHDKTRFFVKSAIGVGAVALIAAAALRRRR